MKKRFPIILRLLRLFICCLFCSSSLLTFQLVSTAKADTISIVADTWCPINCLEGEYAPGYMIEIADEIFSSHGHSVKYSEVNWARAIRLVQRGQAVALAGVAKEEVPELIFPQETMGAVPNTYFTLTNSTWVPSSTLDNFKNIRIGIVKDYDYGEILTPWIEEHRDTAAVQEVLGNSPLQVNIRKLLSGRIDVIVATRAVVEAMIQRQGLQDKIRMAGYDAPQSSDNFYIAFSPAHPKAYEYAKIVDDEIRKMRKDGRLAAILARYGISDWK